MFLILLLVVGRGAAIADGVFVNGCHHLGTRRMDEDLQTSVYDHDGWFHGLWNALVAGAALFPSDAWNAPIDTALVRFRLLAERRFECLRMG